MSKKFSKKFLEEVLGMDSEQVKLVMDCQKKFPSILSEEGVGFCLDGRVLHRELEVTKAFSTWIKTNLNSVDAERNKDYEVFSLQGNNPKGGRPTEEYNLTLDIAKEICMITGLNSKTSEKFRRNSKLIRKYFIYIEKAIKGRQVHISVREPEKQSYNLMKATILSDYLKEHPNMNKYDEEYLMKRECSMINRNLLGMDAYLVKRKLGYMDDKTREHLLIKQNSVIDKIQIMIIGLVQAGIKYEERENIIKNLCENEYSGLLMK